MKTFLSSLIRIKHLI